jgi:hypothetical protein
LHEGLDQGCPYEAAAARDEPVHENRLGERVLSRLSKSGCITVLA